MTVDMKININLLRILLLLLLFFAVWPASALSLTSPQNQQVDDERDPPILGGPEGPNPLPPKPPPQPPKPPPKQDICKIVPTNYCFVLPKTYDTDQLLRRKYILCCYCPGKFIHNKEREFMDLVAQDIRELLDRKYTFSGTFKITGYADGLRNNDNSLLEKIGENCKGNKPVKGNDEALAQMRACIFEKQIRDEFIDISIPDIVLDKVDIPDGGDSGDKFRRIEIEIGFINDKGY